MDPLARLRKQLDDGIPTWCASSCAPSPSSTVRAANTTRCPRRTIVPCTSRVTGRVDSAATTLYVTTLGLDCHWGRSSISGRRTSAISASRRTLRARSVMVLQRETDRKQGRVASDPGFVGRLTPPSFWTIGLRVLFGKREFHARTGLGRASVCRSAVHRFRGSL